MNEQWKNIVELDGYYAVSNMGRVKRLSRFIEKTNHRNQKKVFWDGRVLKQKIDNGYFRIDLCKDGVKKCFSVHRLVATAFIKNPKNLPNINHKDFDRKNNRVENLEWCTQKENVRHAIKNGRVGDSCGSKHWNSKLNTNQVIEIVKSKLKPKILAKKYDVCVNTIYDIKNGRRRSSITASYLLENGLIK